MGIMSDLSLKLSANTADLKKGLSEAQQSLNNFSKDAKTAANKITESFSGLNATNSSLKEMGMALRSLKNISFVGKSKEEITAINSEIKRLNGQMNVLKTEQGGVAASSNKMSGGISSIVGGFAKMLPMIGLGASAMTTFKGTINTTQTAGDAWNITTSSMKGSLEGLYRTIGTGDWSNLIDNIVRGSAAAVQLTKDLDALFEKGQGRDLKNSALDLEIQQLENARKVAKAAKNDLEVIRLGNLITEKEAEKLSNRLKVAEDTKSAFFNNIKEITGLSDKQLINFLTSYSDDEAEKLRAEAEIYRKELNRINNDQGTAMQTSAGIVYSGVPESQKIARRKALQESYDEAVVIYDATQQAYNRTNDANIESAVKATIEINKIKTESLAAQSRNEVAVVTATQNEVKDVVIKNYREIEEEKAKIQWETTSLNPFKNQLKSLDFNAKSPEKKKPPKLSLELEKLNSLMSGPSKEDLDAAKDRIAAYTSSVSQAFSSLGQSIVGSWGEAETGAGRFLQMMGQTVIQLLAMSLAASIGNAIEAGTMSGLGTGFLAAFTTPAFIATGVGGVLAAFAAIPKFAYGGVVGGNSYNGDNVPIMANSGEMILNGGQQARLFAMANGNGGRGGTVEFEIKGDKLVGVLNNYNRKMTRTR